MANILEELSALRREDAEKLAAVEPLETLETVIGDLSPVRSFPVAFAREGVNVIAELKKASPSKGLIRADFHPLLLAPELEKAGAAALSVLCEPHRFLGGEAYLRAVRGTVDIPILYKDFVTTRYQIARARAAGADAVLLIVASLSQKELAELVAVADEYGIVSFVETHTAEEIEIAVDAGAKAIGVNCRDLKTFHTDPSITAELIGKIPHDRVRIAESGIRNADDIDLLIKAGAQGFLIGETLMRGERPGETLAGLIRR